MARTIKMRARLVDGIAQVKSLMPHPMETGTRRGAAGKLIPAHYIERVECFVNERRVMVADWGPSVSKDPYFAFKVKAAAGDVVRIDWIDNAGESSSGETLLK